ncbi:hypothetical protein JCM10207_007101 [Rhodosporidiobolus poonsookiae]
MAHKRPAPSSSHPNKRPLAQPAPAPPPPPDLDQLVHHLAHSATCPPAYAPTSGLVAIPLPSSSSSPSPSQADPFPLFNLPSDPLVHPHTHQADLALSLTHLAAPAEAAHPRVHVRLSIPGSAPSPVLPGAQPEEPGRITLVSFSPDGSLLLAVSSPSRSSSVNGASDTITVWEHRGACIDEGWDVVLQERVGRFGAGEGGEGKRVVSLRWVGEPRRWYPSPHFPDAREHSKKPLYCAPARSAPLSGAAFVAVLSTDELLFMHLPLVPSSLPSILCLPLRPSLSSLSPSSSSSSSSGFPTPALTLSAVPTPATPLPLPGSVAVAAGLDLGAGSLVGGGGAAGAAGEPSPQTTVDALVTSLVAASSSSSSALPGAAAASAGAGAEALHAELASASASSSASTGAGRAGRQVRKAAIGAARCRTGGAGESGETVFVVARWSGGVSISPSAGRSASAVREKKRKEGKKEEPVPAPVPEQPQQPVDDDFSLFADFTSLDEAFGSAPAPVPLPAAAPPAEEKPAEEEDDDDDDVWPEGGRARTASEKWRVEVCEVRVEMAVGEGGPRLTLRPQPPLFLNPTPSPSPSSSSPSSPADPVLTHLTFLGDVALPHPLQTLSLGGGAAGVGGERDGGEAGVDLCLLAVVAHGGEGSRWRSTASSYQLSLPSSTSSSSGTGTGGGGGYPLSEAFHALEGRRLDAPTSVEGCVEWSARHAATYTFEGVVGALEIRPGGGEWASWVVAVAQQEEEGVRTTVRAMSSVTLEPLEQHQPSLVNGINGDANGHGNGNGADHEMGDGEEGEFVLPGGQVYSALSLSPNGGLICALPFSSSPSSPPLKPVIAAPPLGLSSTPFSTRLAVRLAIALARQASTADLTGRVVALGGEGARRVLEEAARVLGEMVGGSVEGTAVGWEILGVAEGVYRALPALRPLSLPASRLLSLASLVRAFRKSLLLPRPTAAGQAPLAPGAYACAQDAVWPLVGHVGWLCAELVEGLLGDALSEAREGAKGALPNGLDAVEDAEHSRAALATFHLLHPLSLSLLLQGADLVLSFRDHLAAQAALDISDEMGAAAAVVEDAVGAAAGGQGLGKVREVMRRVRDEVLPSAPHLDPTAPPLLLTLSLPPSFNAQRTAALALLRAAFPSYTAQTPPTPPRSPLPAHGLPASEKGWDVVRRARLGPSSSLSSSSAPAFNPERPRECLRCGRRTLARGLSSAAPLPAGVDAATAATLASVGLAVGPGAGEEGRWSTSEEGWRARCVCGGMWVRGK